MAKYLFRCSRKRGKKMFSIFKWEIMSAMGIQLRALRLCAMAKIELGHDCGGSYCAVVRTHALLVHVRNGKLRMVEGENLYSRLDENYAKMNFHKFHGKVCFIREFERNFRSIVCSWANGRRRTGYTIQ